MNYRDPASRIRRIPRSELANVLRALELEKAELEGRIDSIIAKYTDVWDREIAAAKAARRRPDFTAIAAKTRRLAEQKEAAYAARRESLIYERIRLVKARMNGEEV